MLAAEPVVPFANPGQHDADLFLTDGGLTAYGTQNDDIFVTTRSSLDDTFEPITFLTQLNTTAVERTPTLAGARVRLAAAGLLVGISSWAWPTSEAASRSSLDSTRRIQSGAKQ
jgi:hypothetical protein